MKLFIEKDISDPKFTLESAQGATMSFQLNFELLASKAIMYK